MAVYGLLILVIIMTAVPVAPNPNDYREMLIVW